MRRQFRLAPLCFALGLVVALLWLMLSVAPPLRLDLGAPGDGRFLWGFYDAELGGGTSFRWSGPRARLSLHGATSGPALLELRMSGERLVATGEPAVVLAHEDAVLAAFDLRPGWRVYRVLLPEGAATTASGEARPLELQTAVSRPGADAAGRDYRALGAPLDWLRLVPFGGAPAGALTRALWLSWLAGVGVAGMVWLARHTGRPLGVWQAAALLTGLGAALALWAWRDPFRLAWALPPTPWALGLVTLLLTGAWIFNRKERGARGGPENAPLFAPLRFASLWYAVIGFGLLALAQGLLHAQLAVGLGIGLALGALLLLCATPNGLGAGLWASPSQPSLPFQLAWLLLGAIFLLALGLRLYQLDRLPIGLWRDEARHGLVALRMAEDASYRPVYVLDERVQLPGLGLAPFAAALSLFGVQLWTMRLVTALAGALAVLPLYVVATWLSGRRAVGLGAALLLAASSWSITLSRFSFPTIYEPLLSLCAWALLLFGLPPTSRLLPPASRFLPLAACLLAGICLGIVAQTYHIGRIAPLAALWLALLLWPHERAARRAWLVGVSATALAAALVVAPLVGYALTRGGDFNSRVGEVFVLGPDALRGRAPLAALDENLRRHLLMFNVLGDANGRHHAPGRPLLDYVSGIGLLLGLAALLRRNTDWRARFLLGALGVGLLPGLLAVDAPHAMRTFGALAPTCIIAALGWAELARMLREPQAALRPFVAALCVGVLAALTVGLNAGLYFGLMPRDPQVFGGFYPVQSQMGAYVRATGGAEQFYVPRDIRDDPSFAFLATGLPVETFEGATLSAPPQPGARFLLSGYFASAEAAGLAEALGQPPVLEQNGPPFPDGRGPTFYVYRLPP